MKWNVRLTEKGSKESLHGTVDAPKYSNAVEAAKEKYGKSHTIHLVYVRKEVPASMDDGREGNWGMI